MMRFLLVVIICLSGTQVAGTENNVGKNTSDSHFAKRADIETVAEIDTNSENNSGAKDNKNQFNGDRRKKQIKATLSQTSDILHYRQSARTKYSVKEIKAKIIENTHTKSNGCDLRVNPKSVDEFNKQVLYEKANLVTLRLRFPDSVNVSWADGVILPFEWRWVYRETISYLKMPYASFVWSIGLLYLHAKGPIDIDFHFVGSLSLCQNLTIGTQTSDHLIGTAFGRMTQHIALKEMRYNTSKWCYQRKIPKHEYSVSIGWNLFHVSPTLEYICCSYELDDPLTQVKCSQRQDYDSIWFDISQILGRIMLLYFPLLLLKLSGKVHNSIRRSSKTDEDRIDMDATDSVVNQYDKFVFLEATSPVTLTSMIMDNLSSLIPTKQSTKSRLAIFVWSVSTLIFPGIELLMWYFCMYDYAVDLAKNHVSFGFSAMLVGWEASKLKLKMLGGPFVALGLYLLIGWLLMLIPKNMSNLIYLGVADDEENGNSILTLNLKQKEQLGSVKIRKHDNGYKRSYKLQVCHLYMLLNPDFWILAANIMRTRWISFYSRMEIHILMFIRYTIAMPCVVIYILCSVLEIIVAFLYYSIPMISFFVCIVRAFHRGLENYISENFPRIGYIFRVPLSLLVLLFQGYYLFMFTKMFLQSFNFISRVLLLTYTAVVAYPKETYGYFMLIITSVSLGIQRFLSFGNIYRLILKITVKLCKTDESLRQHLGCKKDKSGDDIYGISRKLFEDLIENIRPRRVQLFHTLLQLVTMVFVLTVSIEIMAKFEKFEDLSFFVHVFITMFICALPSIYNSVVSTEKGKKRLTRKIVKHMNILKTDVCLTDWFVLSILSLCCILFSANTLGL